MRLRRGITRARKKNEMNRLMVLDNEYKMIKNIFRRKIKASKRACWRILCARLDEDIFGEAYKIVIKELKMKFPKVDLSRQKKEEFAAALLPLTPKKRWREREVTVDVQAVMEEELRVAADRLKEKKAPGPDGIQAEVVKITVKEKI